MSGSVPRLPYADTRIAEFLRNRIRTLAPRKSQRQIAHEIGYEKPNVVSMQKRGDCKVPLERIPAMARALEVDIAYLFKLGMEQWWPETTPELSQMFQDRLLTSNEKKWLEALREVYEENDPAPTPIRISKLRGEK